jgi:hypothetical protein
MFFTDTAFRELMSADRSKLESILNKKKKFLNIKYQIQLEKKEHSDFCLSVPNSSCLNVSRPQIRMLYSALISN